MTKDDPVQGAPDRPAPASQNQRRPLAQTLRLSSVQLFGGAFLLLLGAAAAVTLGQFTASHRAPWISMGMSAGAVLCTICSVLLRRQR